MRPAWRASSTALAMLASRASLQQRQKGKLAEMQELQSLTGKSKDVVFHVGHVMVDNLLYQRDQLDVADKSGMESEALKKKFEKYGVVTLHRPSNVDDGAVFGRIAGALREIAQELPLVFPVMTGLGFDDETLTDQRPQIHCSAHPKLEYLPYTFLGFGTM